MKLMQRKSVVLTALAVAGASLLGTTPSVNAAAITFSITGTGSDGPLAASAQFTTNAGQIQVVLSNDLAANVIRSAGQAVSDITFTLSNDAGNINGSSATGQLGNVSGNPNLGLVTYVSGSPTRWLGAGGQGDFSVVGSVVTLEAIGGGQPDQMIAPLIANGGTYSNVNNGFRNFSPYVIGPATFTLDLSGVTANTTVTSVTFSFGTGPDTFLTNTCTSGCTPPPPPPPLLNVPEPGTLLLIGSALLGFGLLRRRKA
jgi:hypothetical protein